RLVGRLSPRTAVVGQSRSATRSRPCDAPPLAPKRRLVAGLSAVEPGVLAVLSPPQTAAPPLRLPDGSRAPLRAAAPPPADRLLPALVLPVLSGPGAAPPAEPTPPPAPPPTALLPL